MSIIDVKYLKWDSSLLGLRCGLLDVAKADSASSPDILGKEIIRICKNSSFCFLLIKIPCHFIRLINVLVKSGALLIDAELSFLYSGKVASYRRTYTSDRLKVKFLKRLKGDAFISLAKDLRFSRFFNDPHVSRRKAVHLWEESIRNHCKGLKDQLVVAYYDNKPCGIVTLERQGEKDIRLFLVGVLKEYRGKNVGRAMLKAIIDRYSDKYDIYVETHTGNIAAQRLYQAEGFKLANVQYIVHYWKSNDHD